MIWSNLVGRGDEEGAKERGELNDYAAWANGRRKPAGVSYFHQPAYAGRSLKNSRLSLSVGV